MKKHRLLFTLFLLIAPIFLFSQVAIKGQLRLGDTTQVHILNTADGGRLIGRVIGFDEEQVTFLFKNTSRLVFKIEEVKSIEVQGTDSNPAPPPPDTSRQTVDLAANDFMYAVETETGEIYSGHLVQLSSRSLKIEKNIPIPMHNVKQVNLLSEPFTNASVRPEMLHILKTKRGDTFWGQVKNYDGSTLTFLLENGSVLSFSPSDITSVKLERVSFTGASDSFTFDDEASPHAERPNKLFYTPTGFGLKKGEGEYRNLMVLYNTVDYGLTDNITIGAGVTSVIAASIFSARVKFSFDVSEFIHVAAGGQAILGLAVGSESGGTTLGYGAITLGSRDNFLNLGISKVIPVSDPFSDDLNVFTIGGAVKIAEHWRLYGELIRIYEVSFDENYGFFTGGAGWLKRNHKIDFGITIIPVDSGDIAVPAPIIAYSLRF